MEAAMGPVVACSSEVGVLKNSRPMRSATTGRYPAVADVHVPEDAPVIPARQRKPLRIAPYLTQRASPHSEKPGATSRSVRPRQKSPAAMSRAKIMDGQVQEKSRAKPGNVVSFACRPTERNTK
jgi:hypothetical protein